MTHTHFIGIGGTGLSAIARVLIERGEKVSGSDMYSSKNTEMLINLGAEIFISHIAEHVTGADIVVKSSAIPDENPEIVEALFRNIEVLNRKEFLPKMLKNYTTLAISGSHGKTSTTSLLSYLMVEMGIDLSYIVGGEIINLGQNAHAGKSDYFAIEADEYDYMFWGLSPKIAVITNVEHDHPDCFPTSEDFDNAFKGFIDRIVPDGMLIACSDDEGANRMIDYARFKNKTVWTYGFDKNADYRASINSDSESGTHFDFYYKDNLLLSSKLRVLGKHNILNACASLAVLHQLGFLVRDASPILKLFLGAGRRFDIVGEINKTIIVNDYGHHPTEIVSTLEGAKSRYPKRRIWAVWQPHTYSRINLYQKEFSECFILAEKLVVLDVFASRESKPDNFDMNSYIENIQHQDIEFYIDINNAAKNMTEDIKPNDLVITFSAGDAFELSTILIDKLSEKELK